MFSRNEIKSVAFRAAGFRYVALALMCALFAACSDDDNNIIDPDDDKPAEARAFIPEKDKQYEYKITDADGAVTSSLTRVTGVKDSSGISVFDITNTVQTEEGQYNVGYKAFFKGGQTSYELRLPGMLAQLLKDLREIAYIEDSQLTGFPQFQIFENNGEVNSALTFRGDPINLFLKMIILVEEGDNIEADMQAQVKYKSGKAVKTESITTPAGTFNCTKWEYSYDVATSLEVGGEVVEQAGETIKVSLWTAPKVGIVKSTEESEEGLSTTELQKIR